MDLGGYIGIPDTLPEAQAEIVRLLNEIKRRADIDFADSKITQSYAEKLFEVKKALTEAVNMIQAARTALNAVERVGE
jgi:hypothetical protein